MKNKFELRWLERKTGKQLMNEWGYYYPETVRVLQYRNYNPVSYYSSWNGISEPQECFENKWTEWIDVPIIEEKE